MSLLGRLTGIKPMMNSISSIGVIHRTLSTYVRFPWINRLYTVGLINPPVPMRSFTRWNKQYEKTTTALTVVDPKRTNKVLPSSGPKVAFTVSKPMPIRTKRMVQIAHLVNGLGVNSALQQLRFMKKKQYPLDKVIHNASNLMSIRYGIQPEDLVIKSICVGTAIRKKKMQCKGRGHSGIKQRTYSKVHVIVGEGKPKLSKYGEKRFKEKVTKQARIKQEYKDKKSKAIEFICCVC